MVLLAMALSIIVSADFVHVPISWRIAPITTALVMTPALPVAFSGGRLARFTGTHRRCGDRLGDGSGGLGRSGLVAALAGSSGKRTRSKSSCKVDALKPLLARLGQLLFAQFSLHSAGLGSSGRML